MDQLTPVLVSVPIALGLTEVAKRIGLPSQFAPLASILFALASTLLLDGVSTLNIVAGIVYGLTASGLWSGVKATAGA